VLLLPLLLAPLPPAQAQLRAEFVQGATWACAGVVMDLAALMLVPQLPEVRSGILLMCGNYAEVIARVAWDSGLSQEDEEQSDPLPQLWSGKSQT
jgi:hypothetical protein